MTIRVCRCGDAEYDGAVWCVYVCVTQCLVWVLGVGMMIFLFAEGKRDIEPMSPEKLVEMKNLQRKKE